MCLLIKSKINKQTSEVPLFDTRRQSITMPRVIHVDKEDTYLNQIGNKEGGLVSPFTGPGGGSDLLNLCFLDSR